MPEPSVAAFYVCAHQDDWQLFRGEQAYADLAAPTAKVVFVYLTAGDAGGTDASWQRRETGSVASVMSATPVGQGSAGTVSVNDHLIRRVVYNTAVGCFLRLADGNQNGQGFPVTGNQSLTRFRTGEIPRMWAIDLSTAYAGWTDLCDTLRAIVERERLPGQPNSWINSPEADRTLSPGDHLSSPGFDGDSIAWKGWSNHDEQPPFEEVPARDA